MGMRCIGADEQIYEWEDLEQGGKCMLSAGSILKGGNRRLKYLNVQGSHRPRWLEKASRKGQMELGWILAIIVQSGREMVPKVTLEISEWPKCCLESGLKIMDGGSHRGLPSKMRGLELILEEYSFQKDQGKRWPAERQARWILNDWVA